jgi:hypothetical protein
MTDKAKATTEDDSSGSGTTIAAIAAAMRSAGLLNARGDIDRSLTRDAFDTDIGYHEGLRTCLLMGFQSLTAMDSAFNHVKAIKAMDDQNFAREDQSNSAFYGGLSKADSTFHHGLLKSYGMETDNEVLSTTVLAKVVQGLANDIAGIKDAIAAAAPAE